MPVLFVLLPLPHVFCSVGVHINSVSVSLVIDPLPFIHVPIGMKKFPLTVSFSFNPHTFVLRRIGPVLFARAMAKLVEPFAFIHSARLEFYGPAQHFFFLNHLFCGLPYLCRKCLLLQSVLL